MGNSSNMKQIKRLILVILLVILYLNIDFKLQETSNPLEEKIDIVEQKDIRADKIDNYFKERNMPLYGYGKKMVEVADKNGIDWRLLPAISIRESSGGKHMCDNNPFGWGSCKITFNSIDEAIQTVGYKLNNLPVYKGKSTEQKLYYYNGTVIESYPSEVIEIMNKISKTE